MKLKQEIKQARPFPTVQEEAILSLMRTADQIVIPMNEILRRVNLSQSQYNILRILRGTGGEGLACGEISERMVRRDPDLTRLLDRLEKRGFVTRARGTVDRRVVLTQITPEGLAVLAELDPEVSEGIQRVLAHVPEKKLQALIEILESIRG